MTWRCGSQRAPRFLTGVTENVRCLYEYSDHYSLGIVALGVWTRGDRYAKYTSLYIKERKHKRDKRPDGYFVQNAVTAGPVLAVDFGAGVLALACNSSTWGRAAGAGALGLNFSERKQCCQTALGCKLSNRFPLNLHKRTIKCTNTQDQAIEQKTVWIRTSRKTESYSFGKHLHYSAEFIEGGAQAPWVLALEVLRK